MAGWKHTLLHGLMKSTNYVEAVLLTDHKRDSMQYQTKSTKKKHCRYEISLNDIKSTNMQEVHGTIVILY